MPGYVIPDSGSSEHDSHGSGCLSSVVQKGSRETNDLGLHMVLRVLTLFRDFQVAELQAPPHDGQDLPVAVRLLSHSCAQRAEDEG